jgi:Spy/CpxP family protein refolding chaperone
MRKLIQTSAVLLALTLAAAASRAQTTQDTPQSQTPHHHFDHRGGPNPEFETKMLTKRLGLSPEQSTAVEQIFAEQHAQMKALKPAEGTQPDFKALRAQHQALMEQTKQKLDAVLTPEQQQKLAEMHKHHGPGGPGGPHGNWRGQQQPATPAPSL